MKSSGLYNYVAILLLILVSGLSTDAIAKKAKLRLSVHYIKVMDQSPYVRIKAKAKGEDGMQMVSNVEIDIYREFEDTSFLITKIITDSDGIAVFDVSLDKTLYAADSSTEINYLLKAKGGEWYRKAKKSLTYIDSKLNAELRTEDSTIYIVASLTDAETGEPISDEGIKVLVKRLFNPLIIGKDLYYTDSDGMIKVPYTDNIPGKNKLLEFEIVLFESSTYGTVTNVLKTNLGAPIQLESTFNERTMWSPRNKTPYWLLIIPNLIILGIWCTIAILVYNLLKINRS